MSKSSKSASKALKTPEQVAARTARKIGLPEFMISRGGLVAVDVANHSEADHRHSMRSQQTKTVRKLTRIEKMQKAGVLNRDEAAACQWYADRHALGYDTLGVTANYEGGSGSAGNVIYTHLARHRAQSEARDDYVWARSHIPANLLPLFEAVVLGGQSISKATDANGRQLAARTSAFRFAASVLHMRICHLLPIA